jgi:hypothetical protein
LPKKTETAMKTTTDYLKEARRIASGAGLFFVEKGAEFRLFRKTPARVVYLGSRASASGLCSFVKRCAASK